MNRCPGRPGQGLLAANESEAGWGRARAYRYHDHTGAASAQTGGSAAVKSGAQWNRSGCASWSDSGSEERLIRSFL